MQLTAQDGGGTAGMEETTSMVFNLDELWLMQACVRHEIAQAEQWHFPPASVSLNDEIARCILFCEDNGLREAALMLDRHDCLVLDYNVPAGAKDANGRPIGKELLVKTFRARLKLREDFAEATDSGEELDREAIRRRLAEQTEGRGGEDA